jgi:transcriptional regulator with XRE-family HTH domain
MRELREQAGLTQLQVSQILNIERQTYCNYENALRNPPLEAIAALSDLYHVSLDDLICGQDSWRRNRDRRLLHDFNALPDTAQQEVLEFIRFKKYLNQ